MLVSGSPNYNLKLDWGSVSLLDSAVVKSTACLLLTDTLQQGFGEIVFLGTWPTCLQRDCSCDLGLIKFH